METKGQTGRVVSLVDGSSIIVEQRADGAFSVWMRTKLGDRAYGFATVAGTIAEAHATAIVMADSYLSMSE